VRLWISMREREASHQSLQFGTISRQSMCTAT